MIVHVAEEEESVAACSCIKDDIKLQHDLFSKVEHKQI